MFLLHPIPALGQSTPTDTGSHVRTVKIHSGKVRVSPTPDGADDVLVTDSAGNEVGESYCDSGTYDQYVELFRRLQSGLRAKDRLTVFGTVRLPLRINFTPRRYWLIRSRARFLAAFDSIFTPAKTDSILAAEPEAVFCRDGNAMLGAGEVWAVPTRAGARVFVVNR